MTGPLAHRFSLSVPFRIDRVLLATMLGSALLAGGALYLGSRLPDKPRSLAIDPQQLRRFATFVKSSPEPEDLPHWRLLTRPAPGSLISKSAFEPPPVYPGPRYAMPSAKLAMRTGILSSVRANAITSIFTRDSSLGRDAEDALGGLVGTVTADAYGSAGFGLVGSGKGGGGGGFSASVSFGLHLGWGEKKTAPTSALTSAPVKKIENAAAPIEVPTQTTVRAGEWDDNATYREFLRWLAYEQYESYVHMDVSHRRFLVVRDAQGRAMPRCRIVVSDEAGHNTSLRTGPSGRAILFPYAEGLRGNNMVATAKCSEGSTERAFSVAAADGVVDLQLKQLRTLPEERTVDVAFIVDTTASMGEEIAAMKSTLQQVVTRLSQERTRARLALVEFKDHGDEYITRVHAFTTDVPSFANTINRMTVSGGGDTPEAVNEALATAVNALDWSSDSLGRFAFLIGDAPPHLMYEDDVDYTRSARRAAHRGIQIHTVAASGMNNLGQIVWRQVAQYTGGANLFVERRGAGPQSTGAGDPLRSCGGTHTRYTSGNLDELISSRIVRELRALDGDPLAIRGLGKDAHESECPAHLASR